jgi:hypothetical protein
MSFALAGLKMPCTVTFDPASVDNHGAIETKPTGDKLQW